MSDNINILDVTTISESQLPSVISTQINNFTELENNVKEAVNKAAYAKEQAEKAKVSAGLFQKKAAIELLQDAVKGNAEAQISLADAQKLSFEYQKKLTDITKFLFGLGVSSLAMNRCVVRELELRLKGASEEEISDLAKQELRNVILQLKEQEDMMKKQAFLTGKVKEQAGQIKGIDRKLDDIEKTDSEQDQKIAKHAEKIAEKDLKDKRQDQEIAKHAEKIAEKDLKDKRQDQEIAEHAEKLAEKDLKDKRQDREIAEHAEKLVEHNKVLKEQQEKDRHFEKMFAEQDAEDEQQDKRIAENEKIISLHEEKLEQYRQSQEMLERQISEFHQNLSDNIESLKEGVDESNILFAEKLDGLKNEVDISFENLKSLVYRNKENNDDISSKIAERVAAIELFNSKKLWKIGVSAVAAISLILNILQIIGII